MENQKIDLKTADKLEILILADNHSDVLLPGNERVKRPPLAENGIIPTNALLAEHGLSLMITVWVGKDKHVILLDSGYTAVAVPHNLDYLDISLEEIEGIVLSHGHMDHTGALKEILRRAPQNIPLVLHPGVYQQRTLDTPTGETLFFPPFPPREDLADWGAGIIENEGPFLMAQDRILVTGEVPRLTQFEKGMPGAKTGQNGRFEADTFKDDQSLVVHVKDRGLVVISGCAHSGIINSIYQAKNLTGQENVCAVIGGFHLTGAAMAPNVEPTIDALKKMELQLICPMHCTGFHAISRFAQEFGDIFVLSSVGSTIVVQGKDQ